MSSYKVNVSNISATTTKDHLLDFFTFCGKISSIDYNEKDHTAAVGFEKVSAAKTALMLNGGSLDGSTLSVTSDVVHPDDDNHHDSAENHIEQSDKPRAGIAAEYLAKGYTLSDDILAKAIDMDKKHGISKTFLRFMESLDKTVGERVLGPERKFSTKVQATVEQAGQQARTMDEQKGFSKTASDYYSKAIASTFGQKVKAFYTQTHKQVKDIHEEAQRIRAQKPTAPQTADAPAPAPAPASSTA